MRRGFTLFELLVVIVIMGVLVMMVGMAFSGGTDAVRVRTATRGVMQMSKYARTMALLHQAPLDLVFTSDGTLSVAEVGGESGGLVSESAFGVTNSAVAKEEEAAAESAATGKGAATDKAASAASKEGAASGETVGGGAYVMADTAIEKKYTLVTFAFDGYTDSVETKNRSKSSSSSRAIGKSSKSSSAEDEDEAAVTTEEGRDVKTFRIRYKSNGTCRPYRVKIGAEGDEASAVAVDIDMLGSATVEEDE